MNSKARECTMAVTDNNPQRNGLRITGNSAKWIENGEEKLCFVPEDLKAIYDCYLFDDLFASPVNTYTVFVFPSVVLVVPIDFRTWLDEIRLSLWENYLEASKIIFQVCVNPPYRWRPGIFSFGYLGTMDVKLMRETPSSFKKILAEWCKCEAVSGPQTLLECQSRETRELEK